VSFKTKTKRPIQYLAIDATGIKVYGEGEWKVKKYGTDKNLEYGENYILQWVRIHKTLHYRRRVKFINRDRCRSAA